jgi:WD40 repeat protein
VTVAHSARPPRWPLAAVDGALILQGRRGLLAWDPVSGRILRRIPGMVPIATRGSLVASCACTSALHLTDVRTGARRMVGGRFFEASEGAFSPDGKWLAVAAKGAVTVFDLATLDSRRLNPMDPDYHLVAWASSGWLYWKAPGGRIGAWRPGEAARLLPVRVGQFVDMAAD